MQIIPKYEIKLPRGKLTLFSLSHPKHKPLVNCTGQCSNAYHRELYLTINTSSVSLTSCQMHNHCIRENKFLHLFRLGFIFILCFRSKLETKRTLKTYFLKWTWWEAKLQAWIIQSIDEKIQVFHIQPDVSNLAWSCLLLPPNSCLVNTGNELDALSFLQWVTYWYAILNNEFVSWFQTHGFCSLLKGKKNLALQGSSPKEQLYARRGKNFQH